jgi:hypothetical protein
MGNKMSQLEGRVLPIVHSILRHPAENSSALASDLNEALSGGVPGQVKLHNFIQIVELGENAATHVLKEITSPSFSLNIKFENCQGLVCEQWDVWNQKVHNQIDRLTIEVSGGKTPGFYVFCYKNVPMVALMMYSTNFMQWAERIGLKISKNQRTSDPSTHYVNKKVAEEWGLLWIHPLVENQTLGDIVSELDVEIVPSNWKDMFATVRKSVSGNRINIEELKQELNHFD